MTDDGKAHIPHPAAGRSRETANAMTRKGFAAVQEAIERAEDAITDVDGYVVGAGVWTPFNGEDPSVMVGVFNEGVDDNPTPVLMLSPAIAYRLARELMAVAEEATP